MSNKFKGMFTAAVAVFVVGLLAAIPMMVYLILYSIDPNTHFYYDNATLVPVLNVLLIAMTIILIIPIFIKRYGKLEGFAVKKQISVAIISLLLGLSLCFSAVVGIAQGFKVSNAAAILTAVTAFLAAISFLKYALVKFKGKSSDMRFLALMPVIWGVVSLISTFMSLTQIANISEYLYVVLQMVFGILFLYYHARLTGGVSNKREINGVFAFGLPCAFYGFAATLPQYIAHIIDHTKGKLPSVNDSVLIIMSVYILVLLITLLMHKENAQEKAPVTDENTNK